MGYGSAKGMPELVELIAKRERCKPERVVVGPGSKHLLFALLSVLAKRGDNVAIPSPYYPAYALACAQLGLNILHAPSSLEAGWQFDFLAREAKVGIICNPLNPTSTIYGDRLMLETLNEAEDLNKLVILDEAYRGLAFEEMPRYDNAIRVRSFSKEFCMEDWRLGYAIAPEEIVRKIVAFNQATATCVPDFVQEAGAACLKNEAALLSDHRKTWRARLTVAQEALKAEGFAFAKPQAGIYVFATHPKLKEADKFALSLLSKGVAVAPGTAFGNYPRFVRVCANQDERVLKAAIKKMGVLLGN
jgi:aspartate aminotransferase